MGREKLIECLISEEKKIKRRFSRKVSFAEADDLYQDLSESILKKKSFRIKKGKELNFLWGCVNKIILKHYRDQKKQCQISYMSFGNNHRNQVIAGILRDIL